MFKEFPKCLYNGDETKIVFSQEEQDAAIGWKTTQGNEDQPEERPTEPKKRGRPRKVTND